MVYAVCVWLFDLATQPTAIIMAVIGLIAVGTWFLPKKKRTPATHS